MKRRNRNGYRKKKTKVTARSEEAIVCNCRNCNKLLSTHQATLDRYDVELVFTRVDGVPYCWDCGFRKMPQKTLDQLSGGNAA